MFRSHSRFNSLLRILTLRLLLGLCAVLQVQSVAHAGMLLRHALAAPGTVEVCTAEGVKRIVLTQPGALLQPGDSNSPDSQSTTNNTADNHCPACSTLAAWSVLPAATPVLLLPSGSAAVPPHPSPAPATTDLVVYAARAPPLPAWSIR
jgi:hypothetical protein